MPSGKLNGPPKQIINFSYIKNQFDHGITRLGIDKTQITYEYLNQRIPEPPTCPRAHSQQ